MLDAYTAATIVKKITGKDLVTTLLKDLEHVEDWSHKKGKKRHITGRKNLEKQLKKISPKS